jgi:hypothetical protein
MIANTGELLRRVVFRKLLMDVKDRVEWGGIASKEIMTAGGSKGEVIALPPAHGWRGPARPSFGIVPSVVRNPGVAFAGLRTPRFHPLQPRIRH